MEDEKTTNAFNKMMLNTLLVEFFRDVNLQFDVVNNSRFRALCRFICPLIEMPIPQELVSLNSNNIILFETWDDVSDSSILNKHRRKYVDQWTKAEMRRKNAPAKEKPYTEIATTVGMGANDMKLYGMPNAMAPEPPVLVRPPKPSQMVFLAKKSPVRQLSDIPKFMTSQPVVHAEKSPVTENRQLLYTPNDISCQAPLANFPRKSPVLGEETKPELIDNVKVEEQLEVVEDVKEDLFPSHPIPAYTEKQGNGIAAKLITFQDVPGYIKWPCLVCSQRREVSKLRSVGTNDAYIMLYVCVKGGQYDMRKAKELARMEKFKCCVDHLHDLYEQALHSLSIIDPRLDIHTENQKVVEAYHLVKDIKESRCTQKLVFEGSRKHILPFINMLKNFFLKYGRSNYTAQPGQPGYLVVPN